MRLLPSVLAAALVGSTVLLDPAGASAPAGWERAGSATAAPGLPLGPPDLPETRTVEELAPGVTLTTIERGTAPAGPIWTVTAGFRATRAEADTLARKVAATGEPARVEQVDDPLVGDVAGFVVRSGLFDTRAEAHTVAQRLTADGVPASAAATVEDGTPTTGPWVVRVLSIDPRRASVDAQLATGVVPGRETTTDIARRTDAVAAVNGGYFVIGAGDGTPGDLAGISSIDGDLVGEAADGRSALVLGPTGASVQSLATDLRVRADDGATREVDGIDRRPGAIRSCGGVGGDAPTEQPRHDVTCTDPSELISYDAAWGGPAGADAEHAVALDPGGVVTATASRDDLPVPAGGRVLAGTGDGADWLREHARPGTRLALAEDVVDTESGAPLVLAPQVDIVNGGPRLVRDGAVDATSAAEGFVQPANPAFRYGFAIRRNPRTLAGVKPDGTVLLVAADGRAPGRSVGLSFAESADVLVALGARDGLNLDGGGSTALVADGALRTDPSDDAGERPVGDALVVTGRGR